MGEIKILYDLQNALKNLDTGVFLGNDFLVPCKETSSLFLVEIEDVKTLLVSDRKAQDDGLMLLTPQFGKYTHGDRVTITGRIDSSAPIGGWCLELHSYRPDGTAKLIQRYFPKPNRMYALSYVLDSKDIEGHLRLISSTYVKGLEPISFHVDGILITRLPYRVDHRKIVYDMQKDALLSEINGGGYTEYLFATGDPLYIIYETPENPKNIRISCRKHDWDGLDIRISLMNLLADNSYTVKVTGRIDGVAPKDSEMTFQLLPEYAWRSTTRVIDNQLFELKHTFTPEELATIESVRITTNTEGVNMTFCIHSIEIFVNK
ncbi:MAG: hypothetical protein FWC89_07605 [Defluviitaleaceae bacterium]|nr:hypothetical protein [Defluviitaleaceae bacterium]